MPPRASMRFTGSALMLAASAVAPAQTTLFTVDHTYSTPVRPLMGSLTDVNGDGHLDYTVTNAQSASCTVYLGTGTGELTVLPSFPVCGSLRSLAIGYLSGDGHPDVVVVCAGSDRVEIYHGDGAGAFSAASAYEINGFPTWPAIGDLNGDGLQDLAVGTQSGENLAVLLGTGGGALGAVTYYPLPDSCEEIALGDLDGDGDLDVVSASWLDSRVGVLEGAGDGSFSLKQTLPASNPKTLALGDLDLDGVLDLVAASTQLDLVYVYLGTGAGTFGPASFYSTGDYPAGVALGDFNQDSLLDVLVTNTNSNSASVLVNLGGGLLTPTAQSPLALGPGHAQAGDLDQDGFVDLVTTHWINSDVAVYLGDGVGSYVEYCTAKVNSLGCLPDLNATGFPSAENKGPFVLRVTNLINALPGLFFYAIDGGQVAVPFQGGTLCAGPGGLRRTPVLSVTGVPPAGTSCSGIMSLDFNAFAVGLAGGNPDPALLVPGTTYQAQAWARDPFHTIEKASLSDAIDVTIWN